LHVLFMLLIHALYVFQNGHFAFPNRGSSILIESTNRAGAKAKGPGCIPSLPVYLTGYWRSRQNEESSWHWLGESMCPSIPLPDRMVHDGVLAWMEI